MSQVISSEMLKQYVSKIERLEEEKSNLQQDIKEVYGEIKNNGFDVKTIRNIVRMRKMKKEDLELQEELLQLYCDALGM